jgi:hypothetical protein
MKLLGAELENAKLALERTKVSLNLPFSISTLAFASA